MIRNRLYYTLKPLLPLSVRRSIRRWFALRKWGRVQAAWPILPGSEKPPKGWNGWPGGKQFAFVLSHDVEHSGGLSQCRHLMQLESRLGIRSSFNFIPEGDYRVPPELIRELQQNGFEVGVHDLQHDGKLYRDRREFADKAVRINQHLRQWGAVGFRSGFMLRRLDWLHDLEAEYDASTFDTDPFEPQPDGVGTIYPFWVPRPIYADPRAEAPGYVEMPYTLPQDSTLFLVLQERTIEIWKRKLDWIAQHGGMAFLNVHPDYMQFAGVPNAAPSYPVAWYEEFLNYVKTNYGDQCWHALPREVAAFCREQRFAHAAPTQRRVCMLAYTFYESDNRVMRYSQALAERGDSVDAICLKSSHDHPDDEAIGGVQVTRVQCRDQKNQMKKLDFLIPILLFWLRSSLRLTLNHLKQPYDVIHVHNVPDFLVFTAWLPRLTGARIILDIHDIVPEFYASKFKLSPESIGVRLLKFVERWSARFAHQVIISNHLWRSTYADRTGAGDKCSVFINNVDTNHFRRRPRTRKDGKLRVIFPGGLQWHQGLDIAIRAFQKLLPKLPEADFHIYGDGNMKARLVQQTAELGLQERVRFFEPVSAHEIPGIMAEADLGVVPKRADSFGNEAYSTKIMEFMSLGVPVVASSTKIDRYYFDDSVVRFFESGNDDSLADAMYEVLKDEPLRRGMVERAAEYAKRHSWSNHKKEYLNLVDSICPSPYTAKVDRPGR